MSKNYRTGYVAGHEKVMVSNLINFSVLAVDFTRKMLESKKLGNWVWSTFYLKNFFVCLLIFEVLTKIQF